MLTKVTCCSWYYNHDMQVLFGTDTKVGLASQAKNYTQQECQVKQPVKDILFDTLGWILSDNLLYNA